LQTAGAIEIADCAQRLHHLGRLGYFTPPPEPTSSAFL
jgi:hypothetical protein